MSDAGGDSSGGSGGAAGSDGCSVAGGSGGVAGGSGAAAPSPYVFRKRNDNYTYGKRHGNQSGRHRPQTKALKAAEWQDINFDVPSLAAQGASAAGPPQARFMGRGQLDRETETETTTCRHAIAQLQVRLWLLSCG